MRVVTSLIAGLLLCACRQPPAAPIKVAPPVREELPVAAPEADSTPYDPFALDDESDDPAAALESMRHNCCDEMPADEIRKHTGATPQ